MSRSNEYKVFEARLKTLLPAEYKDSYEDVQPVSMGSSGLKFASDGRVAWNDIWQSFCDLAMAGGPPHRGTLLEPAANGDIHREPGRYKQVIDELCRGVEMVTGLVAQPSHASGWINVDCPSSTMAGWLVRAINMENVSAQVRGPVLHLPAGPRFRLEKEIKNVVTSIAKTCHYWLGHTSVAQHRAIADLFDIMDSESPLIQPPFSTQETNAHGYEKLRSKIAEGIHSRTNLETTAREYQGWLGINCLNIPSAIWMMRLMVVSNVLCRREGNFIYIPVNPSTDPSGNTVTGLADRAYRVAHAHSLI